jgi:Zn-dependent protease
MSPLEPMAEAPIEVSADEALYQRSLAQLRAPRPAPSSSLVFIGLLLLFIVGSIGELKSFSGIVILVGVILFHESGHALGMRLFGFRDVRMFFIPLFGAAVSGRPRGVAAWKEAMVSLLGPLPGVLVALGGFLVLVRWPEPLVVTTIEVLLILNAFNLLPFGALDGGRFLQRVLFSRHRVLEVAFLGLGSVVLALFALRGSMPMLLAFALFGLIALPGRWRTLRAAAQLRAQHPRLAPDPDALDDAAGRALFAAARALPTADDPTRLASAMESILQAAKRPPGLGATLGLGALYGFALAAAAGGAIFLVAMQAPVKWRVQEEPGWRVEFPHPPSSYRKNGGEHGWHALVRGTERFTVAVVEGRGAVEPEAWMTQLRDRIAVEAHMQPGASQPIARGREFDLARPGRVMRIHMFVVGDRCYQVTASAPEWQENQRHFLDSFALVDKP